MSENFRTLEEFKEKCGYEINGEWFPRVTKIVDIKAKPSLYHFYAQVGVKEAKEISRRSAEEGTAVHEAVERILIGKDPGDVSPALTPSISAFLDFLSRKNITTEPDFIERRIVCEENRYAGTLDALAYIDGKFGILDIKTSQGIYRDYGLQTSAYMYPLKKEFPHLAARWILRIDQNQSCRRCGSTLRQKGGRSKVAKAYGMKNGFAEHYDVVRSCAEQEHDWAPVKGVVELKELESPWEQDFRAFLGAKALWEWENEKWLKKLLY